MLPLLTRAAVRAVDADSVERLRLPSIVLMENAGRGALERIVQRFADRLDRVVLVGGTGQNGGDAWVIARHLHTRGHVPSCVLVGTADEVHGDAKINLDTLRALGVAIVEAGANDASSVGLLLRDASLVVDGLFGTGLTRPITGLHAQVVEQINASGVPVVALDLPSGIDSDTGAVLGVAVRAQLTVTFAARKPGLVQFPGVEHAGEVVCVGIGVPVPNGATTMLLEREDVARWLPPRSRDSHKGAAGHVVIVAGSPGTSGAAALSALGALRMGAGLVTVFTRATGHDITALHPEIMVRVLPESIDVACADVMAFAVGKGSVVLGPGLGTDDFGRALVRRLAATLPVPTLIDADALTSIGTDLGLVGSAIAPRVLTPHPGEAGRLLGKTNVQVQADRYASAREIAARSGATTVLKGAGSVIALPSGDARVCDRGTPALGVAGTGDVLAGAIGALLAQLAAAEAACAGVYLHAYAGELATAHDRGLLASEVAAALPTSLAACRD